jgi:hypothetical protein
MEVCWLLSDVGSTDVHASNETGWSLGMINRKMWKVTITASGICLQNPKNSTINVNEDSGPGRDWKRRNGEKHGSLIGTFRCAASSVLNYFISPCPNIVISISFSISQCCQEIIPRTAHNKEKLTSNLIQIYHQQATFIVNTLRVPPCAYLS